jgi:hypothetical protein
LTDEERQHAEMLMKEAENWKPGDPPPEHSLEEHLRYARMSIEDVGKDVRRVNRLTILWLVTWFLIIAACGFGLSRILT